MTHSNGINSVVSHDYGKIVLLILIVISIMGCTTIEYGKVPNCDDLGAKGLNCQPSSMFNQSKEPFCKQPVYDGSMYVEYELCQKGGRHSSQL